MGDVAADRAEVEFTKNRELTSVLSHKFGQTVDSSLMHILRIIDEIEQLVEESKNILGKRMVEEEAFFAKIQQLRSALPQALQDAETPALTANSDELSRGDKLRIIAKWSAELARYEP